MTRVPDAAHVPPAARPAAAGGRVAPDVPADESAPEPARRIDDAPDDATPRGRGTVRITPCPDGPLLVRGPLELVGADGVPVPVRRRTVALCRCGGTATPPWCDGTHKVNGFRTEA
jgi:hypothetical protein